MSALRPTLPDAAPWTYFAKRKHPTAPKSSAGSIKRELPGNGATVSKLRWNYGIRVANNTGVTLSCGHVLAINTLGVQPGCRRYFQNVRLTAEADWTCNLAVTWTKPTPKQPAELCATLAPALQVQVSP